MSDNIGKGKFRVAYLALTAVVFSVFWPSLQSGFVNYDDPYYIYKNPPVYQGLTWKGITWAFTTRHASNWHPLTWLSHMLDCTLYGPSASWHHLTNVLLHAGNANLLLLLLYRMTGAFWRSAFVAGLFAIHPLHVESVAWLSERKDLLSTFFLLLTLLAYVRYVGLKRAGGSSASCERRDTGPTRASKDSADEIRCRPIGSYLVMVLCFSAGLMSKPMLVTLPFVMLLLDYWPLNRLQTGQAAGVQSGKSEQEPALGRECVSWARDLVLEKVPLFILSGISCLVTLWAQTRTVIPLEVLPFFFRTWNALLSYARYMFKAVWPVKLAVFYPYPTVWPIAQLIIICISLALITFFAIKLRRKAPYVTVGWFWFLGTLVPVIGLIHVGIQSMADRYTYVPLIGLFIILSWGTYEFFRTWPRHRIILSSTGGAIICVYGLLAHQQVKVWNNSETLFEHAILVTWPNPIARYNLGVAYLENGKMDAAKEQFMEGVRINPGYSEIQNNLANILAMEGKPEQAIDHYQQALKYRPDHPNADYNLACTLLDIGRYDEAIIHFRKALEIQPQFTRIHKDMGIAFREAGQFEDAKTQLEEFVSLEPNFAEGHLELAFLFAAIKDSGEAAKQLQLALSLKPNLLQDSQPYLESLAKKGLTVAAARQYKAILSVQPDNLGARQALAMLLADTGKAEEAVVQFQELLRLRPDASTHYSLGLALVLAGKAGEAIPQFRKAIELKADWPLPLSDLAWILATNEEDGMRNGEEAVRLAEHACELTGYKKARFLGTLDAAYAEVGRFKEALETATKAHQVAIEEGDAELARLAEQRIQLYKAGQPFHQK